MAAPDLQAILSQLTKESMGSLPIEETSERIQMLAADDLAKLKKTKDAGKIVALVKEWHARCSGASASERRQWYKNLDMYQGRQFTQWDQNRAGMYEPPAPDYEPRVAINVTEPICRAEMAKIGSAHPTARVSPASTDDEDIRAALIGERVWEWFYNDSRFQSTVFTPANFWRTICGNGFIKTYYDLTEEDEAATDAAEKQYETVTAQESAQGLPVLTAPPKPIMGKLKAEAVTPFHLLVPDLAEIDIQKQPYIIHQYTMGLERAQMVYADYVPKDWQPSTVAADSIVQASHLGVKGGNPAKKDSVLVIEAWVTEGTSKLLPEGGLVIVIDDEIVSMSSDGLPYDHDQLPFAHLPGIESGRFYRKSIVESILPIQNELNRTYAQIIKTKNLMSKPQFFYAEGSVNPDRITSRAGQYIPIRLGMPNPHPVPMQEVPRYVQELIRELKIHLEDISGQHQVSKATSPGANTGASALAFLSEKDDSFVSTILDGVRSAIEVVARQYLNLVVQFWDEPRLVKIAGEMEAFDVKMLTGEDLSEGTDLRIDADSMLPRSPSARIAQITQWAEKGAIPWDVALQAMEQGSLGKIFDRVKADSDAARRENFVMRDIDPAAVQQWKMEQQLAAEQEEEREAALRQMSGIFDPAIGMLGNAPALTTQPPGVPDNPAALAAQAPGASSNGPGPAPAPVKPAVPARQYGVTAVVQPGAVAPSPPGVLQGSAVPPPMLPNKSIFFPINWYDNDDAHMTEHRTFANSQAYQSLDPAIQEVWEDHYYAHLNRSLNLQQIGVERQSMLAAQQAAQMAQQAPTVQMTSRVGGRRQYGGQQYGTQ